MTFSQKLTYFFITLIGLVAMAFLDFFVFKNLLDMFTTSWLIHVVVFVLMVLLVNPLIVYYLVNLIPFKIKVKNR